MNTMKLKNILLILISCGYFFSFSQNTDTSLIRKIKTESGLFNPYAQLTSFCQIAGSRLNGSDGFDNAVRIISDSLKQYGFSNIHTETFNTNFKNWKLTDFKANIFSPCYFPLIAQPKPYTCGTRETLKSELIYPGTMNMNKLNGFKGKLKGKVVLFDPLIPTDIPFEPFVSRLHDTILNQLNAKLTPNQDQIKKRIEDRTEFKGRIKKFYSRQAEILRFMEDEGVAALIFGGQSPYGILKVMNALTSKEPIDPFDTFSYASIVGNTVKIPQITIAEDQYHSIATALKAGNKMEIELKISIEEKQARQGYSLFADIPGTDLKNEIVMIGAHLDAYNAGNGAADNMAGVVVCMEALRILQKVEIKPRRTLRIAFWGGEEMGLLGSTEYVEKHFISEKNEKLYAYFNIDNGGGAFRGIHAQESSTAREIFKTWINYINEPKFQTISPDYAEDTDNVPFSEAGLPGFQFIQDPLDYMLIFHSNMDIVERIPPEDTNYNAMIMALVAYLASESDIQIIK